MSIPDGVLSPFEYSAAHELPDMKREDLHLSDKYVIIEDGVFDMSKFQHAHPGGEVVMLFTGQV